MQKKMEATILLAFQSEIIFIRGSGTKQNTAELEYRQFFCGFVPI